MNQDTGEAEWDSANWLEPSDQLMIWVARAMRKLSNDHTEPPSIYVTALYLLATICADDMSFEELLSHYDLATWALTAMERYELPEGDPVVASTCNEILKRLRESLNTD